MIGISRMYRDSGGSSWRNRCEECKCYCKVKKNAWTCNFYEDNGLSWHPNIVACKFFSPKKTESLPILCEQKKETINPMKSKKMEAVLISFEVGEQISIFDYI